jgi:hypothetical protein
MPQGIPIGRPWVVVLRSGAIAIDWGDGIFQEAVSGEFLTVSENQISHCALDVDLDWLIRVGRVRSFDAQQVYFQSLPERSKSVLE